VGSTTEDSATGRGRRSLRGVIVALVILLPVLLISAVIYIANVDPLTTADLGLGANAATKIKYDSTDTTVSYNPHGEVYAATILHNSGLLPVRIEGLAPFRGRNWLGYYAAELRFGNGADAGPGVGRPFTPFWLGPGQNQGILITYKAVTDCSSFLSHIQHGSTGAFETRLRFSFLGIHRTQALSFGSEPPFWIRAMSRADCLAEQNRA
jgi:hypothetical protein